MIKNIRVVKKPWGYYEDLVRTPEFVLKKIYVDPGQELSIQYHLLRAETWRILEGSGELVLSNCPYDSQEKKATKTEIKTGDEVIVPKKYIHQVINTGTETLVILELQYGECKEDDIVRLYDKYQRDTKEKEE